MLKVGDRVHVTGSVMAHYFGNETIKLVSVDTEWFVFETEESDVTSFVGQEELFSPNEVEDLLNDGIFRKL